MLTKSFSFNYLFSKTSGRRKPTAFSIDTTAKKEYTYTYEGGNLTRAAEYNITVGADEIITAKDLVNSIIYVYDAEIGMYYLQIRYYDPEIGLLHI